MSKKQVKVIETDYHRNGVGGVGFRVSIMDDPENGRMLVVDFCYDYEWKPFDERDEDCDDTYGYTAVLNLDKAAQGNIYMFPHDGKPGTGDNAWRGDRLGDEYRPLIRQAADAQYESTMAKIRGEQA